MKKLIAMIPTSGRKKEDIIKDATKALNDYKLYQPGIPIPPAEQSINQAKFGI